MNRENFKFNLGFQVGTLAVQEMQSEGLELLQLIQFLSYAIVSR